MSQRSTFTPSTPSFGLGYRPRFELHRFPALLIERLLVWQERAQQRHALRSLDDRMLRDIGLSRADIEAECTKPFWRI